ncbi:MAG TPA: ABC transporter permease [Thermoanaerobaculia bacterium]|nr:ABC transporter permease [Thermoanaerobaculia bacterium]
MSILRDLRHAARGLAREPGFTAVAVLTLGLAIGANTAIFSVADGLLLRPLPLPRADRLLLVIRHFPQGDTESVSAPKFHFLRGRMQGVFSHTAAYEDLGTGFNLVGDGLPERIRGAHVTAGFFPAIGVQPLLGRNFLAEEDRPGARRVVVLSHRLWVRRFAAAPHVLGRQLQLSGETYTVVGVMPASFRFPAVAELWTPFDLDPASVNQANYFAFLGRLRDGVPPATAYATAKALTRPYAEAFPRELDPHESFATQPLQERLYGRVRPALLVLLAAVGAVLLIACVNIANLQLARAAARQREIAIRAALGAGRWRIIRQLLTESVLLALAGGAAGLLLGAAALRPLLAMNPIELDRLAQIGIDGRILAFTLVVSLASGLLFGLAPAAQPARANLHEPLKEGGNRSTGGTGRNWLRRALVVSEVALALVLITGAALLVHSFVGLLQQPPGFDTRNVLTMKLSLPAVKYGSAAAAERFSTQVVERIDALPGVHAAAVTTTLPLEGGPDLSFKILGRKGPGEDGNGNYDADFRATTADILRVLRIPVIRGRGFTAADRLGAPLVALINQEAARRWWPHEDPIGQRIFVGEGAKELGDRGPRTIVGIVGDTRDEGLDRKLPTLLYVPLGQLQDPLVALFFQLLPVSVAVRTAAASPALTAAIQKQIWAVDAAQPINDVKTMEEIRAASLGSRRFTTTLLGLMALLALTLAAVGIYGVLSYLVQQRTREIGVRLALGASAAAVLRMVLRQGMAAVLIGVALGLGGAFAGCRVLGALGLLVGVTARDPLTFLLTPAILIVIAILASSIPAHRASRLDPLVALRQE